MTPTKAAMKLPRARSYIAVSCDCRPEDRLTLDQAADALGVSTREADLLVDEKLLWVARVKDAEEILFCPVAIRSIAEDPALLLSIRRTLTKARRGRA